MAFRADAVDASAWSVRDMVDLQDFVPSDHDGFVAAVTSSRNRALVLRSAALKCDFADDDADAIIALVEGGAWSTVLQSSPHIIAGNTAAEQSACLTAVRDLLVERAQGLAAAAEAGTHLHSKHRAAGTAGAALTLAPTVAARQQAAVDVDVPWGATPLLPFAAAAAPCPP